ncbi:hypothetical protein Tco_1250780 [Tanacetum coccineum]
MPFLHRWIKDVITRIASAAFLVSESCASFGLLLVSNFPSRSNLVYLRIYMHYGGWRWKVLQGLLWWIIMKWNANSTIEWDSHANLKRDEEEIGEMGCGSDSGCYRVLSENDYSVPIQVEDLTHPEENQHVLETEGHQPDKNLTKRQVGKVHATYDHVGPHSTLFQEGPARSHDEQQVLRPPPSRPSQDNRGQGSSGRSRVQSRVDDFKTPILNRLAPGYNQEISFKI